MKIHYQRFQHGVWFWNGASLCHASGGRLRKHTVHKKAVTCEKCKKLLEENRT